MTDTPNPLCANLGFLWTELTLPDAIRAAKRAGFDAVECHWPYDTPPAEVKAALVETGLPMLGLNTRRGDVDAGEMGIAALPGREADARAFIDEAVDYAAAIGARNVHVMAGKTGGAAEADRVLRANLRYALERAGAAGVGVYVEPKNHRDIPGYHVASVGQAAALIRDLGSDQFKMMFDTYHVQIQQGDVTRVFAEHLDAIGHVQIAAIPDRGEPDRGELDHAFALARFRAAGYRGAVAAEYKPRSDVETGLGWMAMARAALSGP